ncbi:SH3 domain-containing protein [Streptomyces purpureus]|uniref:SH3b domain-containing protein n=1 Tax=Streptomyces purpureus TaxID=1951 RepID=A0A918GYA6_9ACTN|nr:SH3 domain-containing protein [Streptomyces purpureus]GGT14844.1 hypothetical protein GCM10014713_04490 [Streptomyces purpureus]
MLKPTRTALALTAAGAVLALAGASAAVADEDDPKRSEATVGSVQDTAKHHAGHPVGKVVSKVPLNVRTQPSTYARAVGVVHPHELVTLQCKKRGDWVNGNTLWYRLQAKNGWVSARYVQNLHAVKWC